MKALNFILVILIGSVTPTADPEPINSTKGNYIADVITHLDDGTLVTLESAFFLTAIFFAFLAAILSAYNHYLKPALRNLRATEYAHLEHITPK